MAKLTLMDLAMTGAVMGPPKPKPMLVVDPRPLEDRDPHLLRRLEDAMVPPLSPAPPPTARVLATMAALQADVPVRRITDPPPPRRKSKAVRNRRKAQRAARKRNRG